MKPLIKKIQPNGYVKLLDIMGSDKEIDMAARVSYNGDKVERTDEARARLIDYLMRNHHTSPFEMAELKFELEMPIFVARQHLRHRTASVNEISMRYSEPPDTFWVPEPRRLKKQSRDNKQMSGEECIEDAEFEAEKIATCMTMDFRLYEQLTQEKGLAREVARTLLPVSTMTRMVWKIDLHNFLHYCKLRMHEHAQEEIRLYALAMYDLVKKTGRFDATLRSFENHVLNSVTLSAEQVIKLRDVLNRMDVENALKIKEVLPASITEPR